MNPETFHVNIELVSSRGKDHTIVAAIQFYGACEAESICAFCEAVTAAKDAQQS